MHFSQIQFQTSLKINLFIQNYLAQSLKICGSQSGYSYFSRNSNRKIPIQKSSLTKMTLKKSPRLLQVHTKFQLDRPSKVQRTRCKFRCGIACWQVLRGLRLAEPSRTQCWLGFIRSGLPCWRYKSLNFNRYTHTHTHTSGHFF